MDQDSDDEYMEEVENVVLIESPGKSKNIDLVKKDNRRRDFFLTWKQAVGTKPLFDLKSKDNVEKMLKEINTEKRSVSYMTIGNKSTNDETKHHEVELVLKIKCKNAIYIGKLLKTLYSTFPDFEGVINFGEADNDTYLEKSRRIVAPLSPRDVDMKPFVYGETFHELLKRIENSSRKQSTKRKMSLNWSMDIEQAATYASGCWPTLVKTEIFQEYGKKHPFQFRTAFDDFSGTNRHTQRELGWLPGKEKRGTARTQETIDIGRAIRAGQIRNTIGRVKNIPGIDMCTREKDEQEVVPENNSIIPGRVSIWSKMRL